MMLKLRKATRLYAPMVLCVVALAGCSSSEQRDRAAATARTAPPSATQARSGAQNAPDMASQNLQRGQDKSSLDALRRGDALTTPANSPLREVYFEFDSYNLSPEARATLQRAADWLKTNAAVRVEIEGHCDERGTSEYNLALGAKRAQAAKDYLMALGIGANRLSTTSYGEEVPVCREHEEDCWRRNRRDRFVAISGKPGI